jgi:N-acetylmuramoyl-L-alanine amidase
VQERLRDVRFGPAPGHPETPREQRTRERLAAAGKEERAHEVSLSAQLGLKIRRVVIDPGHGGHDSGAVGRGGVKEKDVALSVAKSVAAQLRARGLEVVLTRTGDTFVSLEDRARKANALKGDLFISIHCNSAHSKKLRGIETYTLNTSADRYSIRLAARENATSQRGVSDLQLILADLATKANTGESSRLAGQVQRSLVRSLKARHSDIRDLGTKEALFYVLLGTRMPAILVETSFLSHPEEEKRLGTSAYRNDLARAIADGVRSFLTERERLAQID